ncbi:hypothetical protein [Adhaeribacter pallidiroseus]|nr:hypothetical protein [Adhaeribacter pallidiroseus]
MSTLFFKKSVFAILFFLSIFISDVSAQKGIQLTNIKSGKKLKLITIGKRVGYAEATTQDGQIKASTGILSEISASTLTIGGNTINIADIQRFGEVKKGSGFLGSVLTSLSAVMAVGAIASSTSSEPDCSNCNTFVEDDGGTAGTIFLTGLGVGISYLGIRTHIRNTPRKLTKWKMDIIN